jgi:hypothetical protein
MRFKINGAVTTYGDYKFIPLPLTTYGDYKFWITRFVLAGDTEGCSRGGTDAYSLPPFQVTNSGYKYPYP